MQNKFMLLLVASLLAISLVSAYSDSIYIEDYNLTAQYDSAIAGEVFSLRVTIANDANTAKNITLEFDADDPFDFIDDEDATFNLQAHENITKSFRIEVDEDADSRKYDLDFNLDDEDDDWDDNFEIKVNSNSAELVLGEMTSFPSKIQPGDDSVEFSISLKNKGDLDAEDLIATLALPNGFEASSSFADIVHAGDLDAGDTSTLTFYFDVDEYLQEDSYNAELVLEYECDAEDKTQTLNFEIPIFPIPQFEISSVDVLSAGVEKGSEAKIKVAIVNIGGKDAEDVSLKVYERTDQPFSFTENSVYVGSLQKGQTGYAVFEFDVDSDADSISYILDFQVRSVSGNSVIIDDLSTPIQVTAKSFNLQNYLIYGTIGIILLGAAIIFMVRRS